MKKLRRQQQKSPGPARVETKSPGPDRVEIRLRIIEAVCDARAQAGIYTPDTVLEDADAFYRWIVQEE